MKVGKNSNCDSSVYEIKADRNRDWYFRLMIKASAGTCKYIAQFLDIMPLDHVLHIVDAIVFGHSCLHQ